MARLGERRGVHRVLVGKPEGKRPLGKLRLRWEDNMKMDLSGSGARVVGRGRHTKQSLTQTNHTR